MDLEVFLDLSVHHPNVFTWNTSFFFSVLIWLFRILEPGGQTWFMGKIVTLTFRNKRTFFFLLLKWKSGEEKWSYTHIVMSRHTRHGKPAWNTNDSGLQRSDASSDDRRTIFLEDDGNSALFVSAAPGPMVAFQVSPTSLGKNLSKCLTSVLSVWSFLIRQYFELDIYMFPK